MSSRAVSDRTKLLLANSFRNLIKKKPVDKIKIREIVEDCGMNRQTFYYHFQDMYALIEWMYRYDGERIIEETYGDGDSMATARGFLHYAERHKEELISVINSKGQAYFSNFINTGIINCFNQMINEISEGKNIPEAYRRYLSRFYTSAILGVSLEWIKSTDKDRPNTDKLLSMLQITTLDSLKQAIAEYEEQLLTNTFIGDRIP